MIAELLTAVALMWTGKSPVAVHCLATWNHPRWDAYSIIVSNPYRADVYMRRVTCQNLRTKVPEANSIDTFTHELIHVKYPRVKEGPEMNYAVKRYRVQICRLLHVSCKARHLPIGVTPDPWRPK